jgi:hypothetical protein
MYHRGDPEPLDELSRYEQYLRRELPPAVRRELELALDRNLEPLEERLKAQLIEIVRDLQLQLFQSYTRHHSSTSDPLNEVTQSTTQSEAVLDHAVGVNTLDPADMPGCDAPSTLSTVTTNDQLASYEPTPLIEEPTQYGFDAVLFQWQAWNGFDFLDDSAYGSLFQDSRNPGETQMCDPGVFYHPACDNGEGSSRTR